MITVCLQTPVYMISNEGAIVICLTFYIRWALSIALTNGPPLRLKLLFKTLSNSRIFDSYGISL